MAIFKDTNLALKLLSEPENYYNYSPGLKQYNIIEISVTLVQESGRR